MSGIGQQHHHQNNGINGPHQHNQCGQNSSINNAGQDFSNAMQDFSQGNIGGGLQDIGKGLSHLKNPFGFI